MANDGGVWVKMGNAAPAGAAVISDATGAVSKYYFEDGGGSKPNNPEYPQ